MNLDVSTVLMQNITLVYDSLDLQTIDSSKLKGLVGVEARATVMDTPEMIVAVYPPTPIIIQMGDRRTRITFQQESEDVGGTPLWTIAFHCHELVPQSQLVAYGFNYDVGGVVRKGNAQKIAMELFLRDQTMLEEKLGGRLLSFIPRLKFERDRTLYDLILEPLNEQRIKVHLNAHFESNILPSQDQLEMSFRQEFQYLFSMLPELFEGDE